MKNSFSKTIRPTNLQPKLFSVIHDLVKNDDYRIIVDRENQPLCVLVSYSAWKEAIPDEQYRDNQELVEEMKAYYSDMPTEDLEFLNAGIDDGIE